MSFFIAGKKSEQKILEYGIRQPDLTDDKIRVSFRAALCKNYSCVDNDLSLYFVDDGNPSVKRIMENETWESLWAGNEITGISHAIQDAKRILKVSASKPVILADGIDSLTLTIELWKADNSGIDSAVTASSDIPIITPDGKRTARASVVNGQATRTFSTTKAGLWRIPAKNNFGLVRVSETAEFESIINFTEL